MIFFFGRAAQRVVVVPGHLDRRVVRLRPGVGEDHPRILERHTCGQHLRQLDQRPVRLRRERMIERQHAHLVIRGLGQPLVVEAERGAPQPGHALDVFAPVLVPHAHALAARDHQRPSLLVRHQVGVGVQRVRDVARGGGVRTDGHRRPPRVGFGHDAPRPAFVTARLGTTRFRPAAQRARKARAQRRAPHASHSILGTCGGSVPVIGRAPARNGARRSAGRAPVTPRTTCPPPSRRPSPPCRRPAASPAPGCSPAPCCARSETDLRHRAEVTRRRTDGEPDPGNPLENCHLLREERGVEVVERRGLGRDRGEGQADRARRAGRICLHTLPSPP